MVVEAMLVLRLLNEFIKDEKKAECKLWGKNYFQGYPEETDLKNKLRTTWRLRTLPVGVSKADSSRIFGEFSLIFYQPTVWKGSRLKVALVLPISQYF